MRTSSAVAVAFLLSPLPALAGTSAEVSKLNGYAILQTNSVETSKLNGYAVLNSAIVGISKVNAYAVLCNTPGSGGCPAGPVSASSGSMMLRGVGH